MSKAAPIATEHQEQAALIEWFRSTFPGVLIYAIPNGAHLAGTRRQRAAKMATLKAEGLLPGMPDLHVPEWRVWVEMKRSKGGKLSDDQCERIADILAIGDTVIVAHGWDEARAELRNIAVTAWDGEAKEETWKPVAKAARGLIEREMMG